MTTVTRPPGLPRRCGPLPRKLGAAIWRHRRAWLLSVAALLTFSHFYTIGINASSSLPQHVFLILKQDRQIRRGEYVAFRWHGGGPYLRGVSFTKIVRGIPGDVVSIVDRSVYINGVYVSTAKTHATTGQPLDPGPTGVIPSDRFYVHAPNPDSLDSRYAITGWISVDAVIGRAVPVF